MEKVFSKSDPQLTVVCLCCSFWTWHAGVQRTGDGHALDDGSPVSEWCRVCSPRLTRTLHLPADALPVCQLTGISYFSCLLSTFNLLYLHVSKSYQLYTTPGTCQLYFLELAAPILRSNLTWLVDLITNKVFWAQGTSFVDIKQNAQPFYNRIFGLI